MLIIWGGEITSWKSASWVSGLFFSSTCVQLQQCRIRGSGSNDDAGGSSEVGIKKRQPGSDMGEKTTQNGVDEDEKGTHDCS